MLLIGILLGLCSALASSLAYLASRRFTVRHAGHEPDQPNWRGPLRLMVCSHVMLSFVCGGAYLVLMPRGAEAQPADWAWAITTSVFVALFYLAGNTLLFFALRLTAASRISPLLGMKVVLLAFATQFILHEPLVVQQWVAVALASAAAWVLGASGGRLPVKTMLLALGACAGFVCSDLFIKQMVPAWLPAGVDYEVAKTEDGPALVKASITGMSLVYVWCGLIAIALLPAAKPWDRAYWRGSAPYAGAWMTSMVCLFSTFALVGIILGNILQSTRGLMSIALGVWLIKLGHHHIETHAPWRVVLQRAVAALLMVGAIALYVTAKSNG
jgi:drug/metabolite transporter (DMT)-like permease